MSLSQRRIGHAASEPAERAAGRRPKEWTTPSVNIAELSRFGALCGRTLGSISDSAGGNEKADAAVSVGFVEL
jgi:hypothetical protein